MFEREINTLKIDDAGRAERVVEQICANAGLWISTKGTLSAYPGSVHWHLKKEGERGVLDLALWPEKGRAWIGVHDGRGADWIPAMVEKIANDLMSRF